MAQSDYTIANASAPATRAKLNTVFESVATQNSAATAPSTTFAYQLWYDETANVLRIRNAANSAWIALATFDQGTGEVRFNTTIGLSTATWETGTETALHAISPVQLAATIANTLQSRSSHVGPVSTTSGTEADFASLPAGITRMELSFDKVGLNGSNEILVQLGTGGSPTTSGYELSTSGQAGGSEQRGSTAGFVVGRPGSGHMTLTKTPSSNRWVSSHSLSRNGDWGTTGGGSVPLSGALDFLRVTRSGSNTFNAGSVFLRYWIGD